MEGNMNARGNTIRCYVLLLVVLACIAGLPVQAFAGEDPATGKNTDISEK